MPNNIVARRLWQDATPKRRMIAVGVAVNGGAFAVVSEEESDPTCPQCEHLAVEDRNCPRKFCSIVS